MPKRGMRKPAALRVLNGNAGKRPIPEEPAFTTGELKPPAWMKGPALEEWSRVVAELEKLGIARTVNYGNLVGMCRHYGRAIMAMRKRNDVEERQSFEAYRKASAEFGMTPTSAGRVGGKRPETPTGKARFFGT